MITRKEYADRKKVTEKTVRSWVETAGIDPQKGAFTDQEVKRLDYVKTLLDQGKTLAQVAEIIKEATTTANDSPDSENLLLGEMVEDLIGGAIEAIVPQLPHLMVQALSQRRHKIKQAFQQYFALSSSSQPIFEHTPPPPEAAPVPQSQPQLPGDSSNT